MDICTPGIRKMPKLIQANADFRLSDFQQRRSRKKNLLLCNSALSSSEEDGQDLLHICNLLKALFTRNYLDFQKDDTVGGRDDYWEKDELPHFPLFNSS